MKIAKKIGPSNEIVDRFIFIIVTFACKTSSVRILQLQVCILKSCFVSKSYKLTLYNTDVLESNVQTNVHTHLHGHTSIYTACT